MIYITVALGTIIIDISKKVLKIPNLITIGKVISECDWFALVPVATFEELFEIEKHFRKMDGIEII